MTVRKLKPSYIANTGIYHSEKKGGTAQYESFLERNLVRLLEEDSAVKRVAEYPLQVRWTDQLGYERTYTPDLLVEYVGEEHPTIVEVKSRDEIRSNFEFLKHKYRAVKRELKNQGYRLKIMTERQLTGVYVENLLFLKRYKKINLDEETMEELNEFLKGGPQPINAYLDQFTRTVEDQIYVLPTIWGSIAKGHIYADIRNQKLTNASSISLLEPDKD